MSIKKKKNTTIKWLNDFEGATSGVTMVAILAAVEGLSLSL